MDFKVGDTVEILVNGYKRYNPTTISRIRTWEGSDVALRGRKYATVATKDGYSADFWLSDLRNLTHPEGDKDEEL